LTIKILDVGRVGLGFRDFDEASYSVQRGLAPAPQASWVQ